MKKALSSFLVFSMLFIMAFQWIPLVYAKGITDSLDLGFEDGMAAWHSVGDVIIEKQSSIPVETDLNGDGFFDNWRIEAKGNGMAVLWPIQQQPQFPMMADSLKLSQGSQNYLQGLFPNIIDTAFIYRDIELEAGDEFEIGWNYVATDYEPFNDASFVSLVNLDNPQYMPIINGLNAEVGLLGATVHGTGNYSTGSYGSTGWQIATFKVLFTGTYRLGLAVFNLEDYFYPPCLFIDDGRGRTFYNGVEFAPIDPDPNAPPPPATAITVSGNPTEWTAQDAIISFTLNDNPSDIVSVFVEGTLSGDVAFSYDEDSGTYSFVADKNEVFTVFVTNVQGIQTLAFVDVTKIDKAAPTILNVSVDPVSWTNTSVLVTVTAVDAGAGIAAENAYSFDDGLTWQTANTKAFSVNTSGIKIKVKDALGNISESTVIDIANIDKTPPVIQSVTGNPEAWQNTDVTLTVHATDAQSGIPAACAYSFDGGATWQDSNTKTFSENTSNIIIKVKDVAGNISEGTVVNITKIDKTAPVIQSITGNPTAWQNTDVTLTVHATDAQSGIPAACAYSFDGGATWQDSNTKTFSSNVSGIAVKIKDAVGNISDSTIVNITKIDKAPPAYATIQIEENAFTTFLNKITFGLFFKKTVNVSISAADELSGIQKIEYQKVSDASEYNPDGTWTVGSSFSVQPDEKFIVYARITDNAGNYVIISSDGVIVDATCPILTLELDAEGWATKDITVGVTVTDNLAGVKEVTYTTDEAVPQSGAVALTDGQGTITLQNEGVYQLTVTVTDNAGNTTTQTIDIKIDKTLPQISSVSGNPTEWTPDDVTLTVHASDSLSGLAPLAYSFDDGMTWQAENTKTYAQNTADIRIKVRDAAGNIQSFEPVSINRIDKTPPENAVIVAPESHGTDIWHTTDKTVAATFMPTPGCTEKLQYKVNAGDWTDGASVIIAEEGRHTVTFRVVDALGRASAEQTALVNVDKTAPANLQVQYGTHHFKKFLNTLTFGLFFKDTVTVTLSADDAVSGVKEFTYILTGQEAKTISAAEGQATFTIAPSFIGNFSVTVKDIAGNSTTLQDYEYLVVDSQAPTAPAINSGIYKIDTWTSGNVVLTVSGAAALSGIAKYQYTVTSGAALSGSETWTDITDTNGTITKTEATATAPSNVTSASITVSDTGNVYYHFRAVSNSGLYGQAQTIAVKIDKVTPSISVNANGYDGSWTKNKVRFDLSNGAANISGTSYYYSTDNGANWYPTSGTTYHEIESDTNGVYQFKAVSGVGLESISGSYTVRVQKTAPQNAVVAISPAAATGTNEWYKNVNGTRPTITITAPAISGTAPIIVKYKLWTGGEPADGTVLAEQQPVISADGVWNLKVWTEDAAGNKSNEIVKIIKVDTTAPTGTIQIKGNAFKQFINAITFGLFFKQHVDVSITADADLSGIAKIEYYKATSALSQSQLEALNESNWILSAAFSVTPNEKFVVYARITDKAGNVSVINSEGVVVYTDSGITENSAYFDTDETRNGYQDIIVQLELNGNTLESVKLGSVTLQKDTDYTLDENILTLKKQYLKTVVSGTVTFTLTFAPMGETFEDGTSIGDAPSAIEFTVIQLVHAQVPVFVSDLSGSKGYTKGATAGPLSVEATVSDNGEITYQWYVNGVAIDGATGASYTPDTDRTGVYDYYVVATSTNTAVTGDQTVTAQSGTCRVVINNAAVNEPIVGDDAPNTAIQEDSATILDAVLTSEDQERLENGYDISVNLQVQAVAEPAPEDADTVYQIIGDNTLGQYIDISLIKTLIDAQGNKNEEKVTQLNKPLTITIEIPEELLPKNGEIRKYSIIRIHNGVPTILEDLDDVLHTITIQTDCFSTYAIIYKTTAPEAPQTSDLSYIAAFAMVLASLLPWIAIQKRKKKAVSK